MSSKRYAEEFKIEAVKQITERRYPVAGVSARLGVSQHSLYKWVMRGWLGSTASIRRNRGSAKKGHG